MNCQHCNKPNKENWFYCRGCGKRASAPKFTTNSWMRTGRGARTDVEFNTIGMEESVNKMRNQAWGMDE
tara:strand:- start:892 stop:1098 length:207 start_codon:yes stop_codon:yes gene_type:complete